MDIVDKLINKIQIAPLLDTLRLQKIDDEEYFSEKYNGYISNSRLSLINPNQDNDPKAFFEGLSKHNKYSDALIFGSAVHELTLQPELFSLCECVDRPTAKAGFMADELWRSFIKNGEYTDEDIINASNKIDYYKGKMNEDRIAVIREKCNSYFNQRKDYEQSELFNKTKTPIYLDPKSRERLSGCLEALAKDKSIQSLLNPEGLLQDPISENEQAILLDVLVKVPSELLSNNEKSEFTLRIKAKLDNYTIDNETDTIVVNDVKTIGKIVSEFENNFEKFHYFRELGLYCWLLSLVVKKYYNMDNPTIQSNCLVVSTIPNYYTKVYKVNKIDFTKGWEEFKFLLKLAAYYYSKGYRFS